MKSKSFIHRKAAKLAEELFFSFAADLPNRLVDRKGGK